ncbi:hypothetical protein [uncultured Marivirga sp.]|uniref:hypothetical protein n=1 Tax=uncultured Marivirga sp. TaxID=1123707 RepID=UPI0030EBB971|tara:strand:- start:19376 stop:20092 length:717 start_codon:yes stop_codon:yes gene_type:complete
MEEQNKNIEVPRESPVDKVHSVVKGAIGSLPLVGGVASEVFGMVVNQPITKRREQWMEAVVHELEKLQKEKQGFDLQNLKDNEEFVSFLIETSQIAVKNHQEEKIRRLKNSIGNYFRYDIEYDKKFSYLRIIDELSVQHIKILMFIKNRQSHLLNMKGFDDLYKYFCEHSVSIDKHFFRKCFRDLENLSLISINNYFNEFNITKNSGFIDQKQLELNPIILLEFGSEFISFINDKISQ